MDKKRPTVKAAKGTCSVCGRRFTPIIRALTVAHPNLFGGTDRICATCWTRSMDGGTVKHNGGHKPTHIHEDSGGHYNG